jgi:hypothetical protein
MKLFSATGSCSPSPHIVAHEAGLPGACLGASRREGRHESGRAADRNRVRCDIDGSHRRLIRFAAHAPAILSVIVLAGALAGCASPPPAVTAHGLPAQAAPAPNVGRPFEVVADESSLIVLVYRAGALAALGHNHVISCRCISGTLYLPGDPLKGSFDLRIAVARLTVDDPSLRAAERSADFPADVPQSARQGTRHNMLGAALLYAARYPQIRLRAVGLRPAPAGSHRGSRSYSPDRRAGALRVAARSPRGERPVLPAAERHRPHSLQRHGRRVAGERSHASAVSAGREAVMP